MAIYIVSSLPLQFSPGKECNRVVLVLCSARALESKQCCIWFVRCMKRNLLYKIFTHFLPITLLVHLPFKLILSISLFIFGGIIRSDLTSRIGSEIHFSKMALSTLIPRTRKGRVLICFVLLFLLAASSIELVSAQVRFLHFLFKLSAFT